MPSAETTSRRSRGSRKQPRRERRAGAIQPRRLLCPGPGHRARPYQGGADVVSPRRPPGRVLQSAAEPCHDAGAGPGHCHVNLVEAYKWFELASRAAEPHAAEERDLTAKKMSSAQINEPKQARDAWQPKYEMDYSD